MKNNNNLDHMEYDDCVHRLSLEWDTYKIYSERHQANKKNQIQEEHSFKKLFFVVKEIIDTNKV